MCIRDRYNYCKSIPGLLEPHIELTPFSENRANWTEEYWTSLKMDLIKNFSDKRMSHMRDVAQVFLADKVQRILAAVSYTHLDVYKRQTQSRVTLLHNGIRQGKIQIPELHDIISGAFGKYKGIRIKFQKIGYESILIGGMAARITR